MKKSIITATVFFLLFGFIQFVNAQSIAEAMKLEAQREMQVGRYGEAIDLLNKYISAHPQQADGYNLRGLCYEKRQQFEYAVYDYRSARKLEPNNKEINNNLERATKTWYTLLFNDIEGYKREIAINPNNPENYLSIGKCYKNMGQWAVAEQWYDKYLTMTHASPDEIIRYSEILAKTGHIAKGWPILKRYTEEYPNDQRLWSRYGYFSMWLGKNKIAIEAFENSLALKPFFKEAMDGLDEAKGKGYIYTVNDTSVKHFNYGMPPVQAPFVYPIDRYYGILKRNPGNDEIRFKLVKALYDAKRYEEASQQIQILESNKYDSVDVYQFASQLDTTMALEYRKSIADYKSILATDSTNKKAVLAIGDSYSRLTDYDSALMVYATYLNKYPDDQEVLFAYAKAQANNRDFNRAEEKMTTLLQMDPNNLKYQLFKAQLDVWLGKNFDEAKGYLNNVLTQQPDNIAALTALSSLNMQKNDFIAAQKNMDKIKSINPDSPDLHQLQTVYELQKSRYKQEQELAILQDGRQLYGEGKCQQAIPKYEEFMAKSQPNVLIEKEFADVNVCAKNYQKAIDLYTDVLNQGYDYNVDLARAEAYYYNGDSVNALKEFQRLVKSKPDNFNANLYLGDSYVRMHEYDKARDTYDNMENNLKLDSAQTAMVEQRYSWMPVTGFRGILATFPSYVLLTPYGTYYSDNLGIKDNVQGLRVDLGVTSFLTVGVEGFRTTLASDVARVNANTIRWDLTFRLAEALTFGVNFGNMYFDNAYTESVADVFVRSEKANLYSVSATYSKLDASQVIYSPYLIGVRMNADMFNIGGFYQFKSGLKTSASLTTFSFSDGNQGYNLDLRIGKYFYPDFILGYEYYNSGFKRTSFFYYSPISYSSHNIWADWDIVKESDVTVTVGGLIGFVANSSYILRQAHAQATYRVFDRLTLQGSIIGGSSFQNYAGYSSFWVRLAAYWSL